MHVREPARVTVGEVMTRRLHTCRPEEMCTLFWVP
jgi:hypothetical protein